MAEAAMNEQGHGTARAVEFQSDANVTKSIVGIVKARDLHLSGSGAGLVAARRQPLDSERWVRSGRGEPRHHDPLRRLRPLVANGDVLIETGGAQAIRCDRNARTLQPNPGRHEAARFVPVCVLDSPAHGRSLTACDRG
jgi:hypothetical protein